MSLPIIGQQYGCRIWMSFKLQPEHVVCFALHRFGPRMDIRDGRNHGSCLRELNSDAQSSRSLDIKQIYDEFETFCCDGYRERTGVIS